MANEKQAKKKIEDNRNLCTLSIGAAKQVAAGMIAESQPADCSAMIFIGPVGMGKTEVWQQIARENNLELVVRHFSQIHPLDVAGVGLDNVKREMYFAAPPLYTEVMEARQRSLKNGGSGKVLLVLDELDRAAPLAQSALLQVLSEGRLNGYSMKEFTYIVGAANAWYAQYTFEFDKALASRLMMMHVLPNADSWLAWAGENGIDPRIITTISMSPDVLNQHTELTEGALKVADPRAWAALSRALAHGLSPEHASVVVGEHAASVFNRYVAFSKDYSKEIEQVLAGKKPTLTKVAEVERNSVLFGVYLAAAGRVDSVDQARGFIVNACDQIGDERAYIASKIITYNIKASDLCNDPVIRKLHMQIRGAALGKE